MRASRPWSEGSSNVPCLSIGRSITLVNRDIRGLIWAAVMGVRNRPAKRRDLPSVECPNASPARFRASAFLCPRTKRMAGAGMLGLEAGRTGHRGLGFDWDRPPHDQATYILAIAQLRLKSLQLPAGGMAFSPMPHIRRAVSAAKRFCWPVMPSRTAKGAPQRYRRRENAIPAARPSTAGCRRCSFCFLAGEMPGRTEGALSRWRLGRNRVAWMTGPWNFIPRLATGLARSIFFPTAIGWKRR